MVGIAKLLVKKYKESKGKLNLCLLDYRNSWVAGLKASPSQLLMSRVLQIRLPIGKETLKPNIQQVNVKNREQQSQWYNMKAKSDIEYEVGKPIMFQGKKKSVWSRGFIVEKAGTPRSYWVKDGKGVVYRRSSCHLRKVKFINQFPDTKNTKTIDQNYLF